jgi:hypothetical protein
LRHAEPALRLAVIEGVGEPQALVEIGLRALVRGGDLPGDGAGREKKAADISAAFVVWTSGSPPGDHQRR